MSDGFTKTITVAASGTKSDWFKGGGYTLIGLVLPALDSTTIEFEVSVNGTDANAATVSSTSGTVAARTLGNANTGGNVQPVPEEIGRLAAIASMRLVVATQSEQRTITALFQRR